MTASLSWMFRQKILASAKSQESRRKNSRLGDFVMAEGLSLCGELRGAPVGGFRAECGCRAHRMPDKSPRGWLLKRAGQSSIKLVVRDRAATRRGRFVSRDKKRLWVGERYRVDEELD